MNIIFLPIICLISLTQAEPPVGDGYPAARSSHDHHHDHNDHHDQHNDHHDQHNEHQRSLSQEYGPPSLSSRNAIDQFSGRTTSRGRSQFPPATVRVSYNQKFPSAAARNSDRARNQAQTRTNTHTPSQEYGAPASRSLAQEYGTPAQSRSLSSEYGVPKSSPSEQYGAPAIAAARNNHHTSNSNFRSQPTLSSDYSKAQTDSQSYAPSLRSNEHYNTANSYPSSDQYNKPSSYSPSSRSNENTFDSYSQSSDSKNPSETYGAPKNNPSSTYGAPSSRALSTNYGPPSARNADSNSEDYNAVSQSYAAPSEKDLSETYGAPNARSLSEEYGVPSSRSGQNTDAVASTFSSPSSRSSPSSTYLPAAREAMPSQQYGVPDQDNQGYEDARARALNELLNQEPANYDFAYQIEDQESGSDFGHTETREENRAEGSYFVVLPDGTRQTVEYEADEGGFKPRISVEPADAAARAGGYDENAQDLTNQGPY